MNEGCAYTSAGRKIEPDSRTVWAISLTRWQSIEAYERFIQSLDAGPFFALLSTLVEGPPSINHYRFDATDMQKLVGLGLTEFVYFNVKPGASADADRWTVQTSLPDKNLVASRSLEDSSLAMAILGKEGLSLDDLREAEAHPGPELEVKERCGIEWASFGSAARLSVL